MKNQSRSIAVLGALLAAGSGPWAGIARALKHAFPAVTPVRTRKHYPEQSSRQALRGLRRAQGGPGIVLRDGVYVARSA